MAFFRDNDCTTLKTREDAIFNIDSEQIVMDRKINPKEANVSSINYVKGFIIDNPANEDKDINFIRIKHAVKNIRLVLKCQNSLPPQYDRILATLNDKIETGSSDNATMAAAIALMVLDSNTDTDVQNKLLFLKKKSMKVFLLSKDRQQSLVNCFVADHYQNIKESRDNITVADTILLCSNTHADVYNKLNFLSEGQRQSYVDRFEAHHNLNIKEIRNILMMKNASGLKLRGSTHIMSKIKELKMSQIALLQSFDYTPLYDRISEEALTLSVEPYRRYHAMFEMSKTAFGNTLEHHLNCISESIANINQIVDKSMQTEQKALYKDSTLRYQVEKNIVLDQIFRTQKKKIDQEMEMTELIAKVITKIDKMIKAGQKVSEAFIMDICNEIIGKVFGIIEASNSFVDILNGLVGIIKDLKAVYEAPNERCFADNESHACTDNHIGPERHKNKNTKLKSNERIPHVFDLTGEIRKLSKSLLEDVSRITPTLLQLGLQMLKRTSYLWMSDNDLNLSKIGGIEDYGLDFQCPLPSNRYMKRMSTFKTKNNAKGVIWNEETTVKPEQLVGAGFSFDGKQDHVRCTLCECTSDVSQWNRNDEEYAISIHKGLAKDCIFVKTYGGSCMPEYV